MAASSSLPLAVLIFILVLVASAVPATAGGEYYSGARMVIIRGPATTRVVGVGAAGAQSNKWRQHYDRRLVEDEVAPELGSLLGAGEGSIGYGALNKDGPACPKGNNQGCAAKDPGQPYTRGCTYQSQCAHTPSGVAN